jgi:hypothetical protein
LVHYNAVKNWSKGSKITTIFVHVPPLLFCANSFQAFASIIYVIHVA